MSLNDAVLVTGAGGLIGSWCMNVLHRHGMNVAGWYKTAPKEPVPWTVFTGDLSGNTFETLADASESYSTIVHTAAYLPANAEELENALNINRRIDENIIRYAAEKKARLVYLSGTSIYGPGDDLFTEESVTNMQGIARKYEIEPVIREKIADHVILRVSAPYGPYQKSRTVLRIFIENALNSRPLLYYGSGKREQDFTFAEDIAEAVLKCIELKEVKGTFNITSGQPVNMQTLANLVVNCVDGSRSVAKASGMADAQEDARANYSIEKAKRILGWHPVPLWKMGSKNG